MRTLTSLLLFIPLLAQDPGKPSADPGTAAAPAQDAAKPAQEPAKPAEAPAKAAEQPAAEGWIQGSLEVGYRWIPNVGGNFNAYRSVVNLGEGPKLFNADFTLLDPKKRVFDRADVHASSWGGDPYNTMRVDLQREGTYRLTADYRNIAYFNFLPSFANPALSQGVLLDQNSFDTKIRSTDVQLDLLPNKWLTPFLGFGRNTRFGRGITVFRTDRNEYPVASLYSDQTGDYRGGVRLELGHYHVTLEQGGTTFKEDEGASDALPNPGNFTGLFLGGKLPLTSMSELYRVRGDSIYTRALLAANPWSWASVTGQFVYARPRTDINYTEAAAGTFYLQRILQFYSSGRDLLTGDAIMPHTSGSVTFELRPVRRLRVVQYWMTDRFHNAASALLAENFLLAGAPLTDKQLVTDRMALNYNQEEVDVYFDLTAKLTIRGGYRYLWGDTSARAPILTGLEQDSANLSRHVGIGGVNYRIGRKIRVTASAEGSSSSHTFFRTSLQDYQKANIRARYDLTSYLRLAADFSVLNNTNAAAGTKLDFSNRIESASLYWTPRGGKWIDVVADYSRSALRSNILFLTPQVLAPTASVYRENGHAITMVARIRWVSLGGSLFLSSGSRPTNYYQPLARVALPLHKHVQWIAEWRWYSMSEAFYTFENFRGNQLMIALRFTR